MVCKTGNQTIICRAEQAPMSDFLDWALNRKAQNRTATCKINPNGSYTCRDHVNRVFSPPLQDAHAAKVWASDFSRSVVRGAGCQDPGVIEDHSDVEWDGDMGLADSTTPPDQGPPVLEEPDYLPTGCGFGRDPEDDLSTSYTYSGNNNKAIYCPRLDTSFGPSGVGITRVEIPTDNNRLIVFNVETIESDDIGVDSDSKNGIADISYENDGSFYLSYGDGSSVFIRRYESDSLPAPHANPEGSPLIQANSEIEIEPVLASSLYDDFPELRDSFSVSDDDTFDLKPLSHKVFGDVIQVSGWVEFPFGTLSGTNERRLFLAKIYPDGQQVIKFISQIPLSRNPDSHIQGKERQMRWIDENTAAFFVKTNQDNHHAFLVRWDNDSLRVAEAYEETSSNIEANNFTPLEDGLFLFAFGDTSQNRNDADFLPVALRFLERQDDNSLAAVHTLPLPEFNLESAEGDNLTFQSAFDNQGDKNSVRIFKVGDELYVLNGTTAFDPRISFSVFYKIEIPGLNEGNPNFDNITVTPYDLDENRTFPKEDIESLVQVVPTDDGHVRLSVRSSVSDDLTGQRYFYGHQIIRLKPVDTAD